MNDTMAKEYATPEQEPTKHFITIELAIDKEVVDFGEISICINDMISSIDGRLINFRVGTNRW